MAAFPRPAGACPAACARPQGVYSGVSVAFNNPLAKGAILADEVGLGKTIDGTGFRSDVTS